MTEVFADPDYTRVGYAESILREAGIACFIRNASTHNLLTGIPSHLFFPRLCVLEESDVPAALELLRPLREGGTGGAGVPDWVCAACGETVPGGFEECWNCGRSRVSGQAG